MNSEELSNFTRDLRIGISDGLNDIEFFIEKWKELNDIDKDELTDSLEEMCIQEMQEDEFKSKAYYDFKKILNVIRNKQKNKSDIKKFNLSNGAKAIEIVKIFLELKQRNYIDNNNEDTATLICTIFDIKYNTALSYLDNPKKLEKTKDILK